MRFHEQIVAKIELGLTAQRIYQDLVADHGFSAKYHSVRRYVAALSLAEQNQYLIEWEKNVADTRIHGTTKKHVGKQFLDVEKATLAPLPTEPFPIYEEGIRKVSRDGHIEVKGSYYSAPPEYLGCEVWVRWNDRIVRIFNKRHVQIAIHARMEKGKFSTLSEHIAPVTNVLKGASFSGRVGASLVCFTSPVGLLLQPSSFNSYLENERYLACFPSWSTSITL